ncbi:MAG: hypothetical protein JO261_09250, partial [Alphaproteobacteria bacterium]|nr:hypothetical protein [Alphaproteobacteria bacterium]
MRTTFAFLALAASVAGTPAYAADPHRILGADKAGTANPAEVLAANKSASGGTAWDAKAAVRIEYAYSGQGMTGSVVSVDDVQSGRWLDDAKVGPATETQGFDGSHTWVRDQSGTVTQQSGGDTLQLAFNEAYRRANLWWRPDFGGATVVSGGEKIYGGATFEVLTVTPRNGKAFDAWFDAKTHLLSRTVESQGPQVATTTLSDYRLYDGVALPGKVIASTGDPKYDQIESITAAAFEPMPPDSTFAMPANKVADFSIAGGAAATTLPFQLVNNHIYAPVAVNGKTF